MIELDWATEETLVMARQHPANTRLLITYARDGVVTQVFNYQLCEKHAEELAADHPSTEDITVCSVFMMVEPMMTFCQQCHLDHARVEANKPRLYSSGQTPMRIMRYEDPT